MKEVEIDGKKVLLNESYSGSDYRDKKLRYLLDKCYILNNKKSRSALKVILRAIKKYPRVPQFRNFLAVAYANMGMYEKANEVVRKTVELFPNYLFGKINLVQVLLNEDEPDFDYIDQLLGGENKNLISFFPNSPVYYVDDFYEYYSMYANFEAKQGNRKGVEKAIEPLLDFFGEEHPDVIELGESVAVELMNNYFRGPNIFKHSIVESFPVFTLESTTARPELVHDELYRLYEFSVEKFPVDLIEKIINLPRISVVEDLERILYDSIRRFESFQEDEKFFADGEDFPISAMYFLAVLGDKGKLESVLNFLRQGEEFLGYWVGDYMNDYVEPVVNLLGKDQLDVLQRFIMEPNVWWVAKSLVLDVMAQVAIQDETKRAEVIQRILEAAEYLIENADNKSLFDTSLFASFMMSALDMRAIELLPLIEDLFERGWVDSDVAGDLEEIKSEIAQPFDSYYKRKIPEDIFEVFSGRYNDRESTLVDEGSEKVFYQKEESRASRFLTNSGLLSLKKGL